MDGNALPRTCYATTYDIIATANDECIHDVNGTEKHFTAKKDKMKGVRGG